jgi:hypothetical protein
LQKKAVVGLVPQNSRQKYELVFNKFKQRYASNSVTENVSFSLCSSGRQPIQEFEKNEIDISNENLQETASRVKIQDAIIVPPTPSTRPLEQLQYSIDVDYSYNNNNKYITIIWKHFQQIVLHILF